MKRIMIGLIASAFAAPAVDAKPAPPKREPTAGVKCQATALEAAKFIDKLGWGEDGGSPLRITSGKRDRLRNETFEIKSTVSDFTYKIVIIQDQTSEACIVVSLTTN